MRFTHVTRRAGKQLYDHKRLGKFNPWVENKRPQKTVFSDIYAQQSTAAPPLGPILASRGITVMRFNEDFNNRSVQYEAGVLLRTRVNFEGAGKWNVEIMSPPLDFHILQAAGMDEPSFDKNEIQGIISLKHCYEIARFHAKDNWYLAR